MQPLPVPDFRWRFVSMDLITWLLKFRDVYDAIVVLGGALTKMVHLARCYSNEAHC